MRSQQPLWDLILDLDIPLAQVAISFGLVFAIPGLLNGEVTRKLIAHRVSLWRGTSDVLETRLGRPEHRAPFVARS